MDFESAAADAAPEDLYPPPKGFTERALIKSKEEYDAMYKESIEEPEKFWSKQAEPFHWEKKWTVG
jgi:acetyl-CoA synthetase